MKKTIYIIFIILFSMLAIANLAYNPVYYWMLGYLDIVATTFIAATCNYIITLVVGFGAFCFYAGFRALKR